MLDKIEVNAWLEDLTYNCAYEFLEEGSKELDKVAKKYGIKKDDHDLALFKAVYAFVDKPNKNGCTLPKDEVKKSLSSLRLKPVDFDHFRGRIVGTWLDAVLEGDKIVAYGVFYKSNLADDYEIVKSMLQKGEMKVSFEAWGVRNYTSATKYDLTDIVFCGGALLITTKPAFTDAEVLEMSNKRVLELASIMTPPKTFIREKEEAGYKCSCVSCGYETTIPDGEHCSSYDYGSGAGKCPKCGAQMRRATRPGPGKASEEARLYVESIDTITKLLQEIKECPACGDKNPVFDILSIDFENDKVRAKHTLCESILDISLEPTVDIVKKGKKIKEVKVELKNENSPIEVKEASGLTESDIPKEVQNCVRDKCAAGMPAVQAVKQCWKEYKKNNKGSVTDKMSIDDILGLLQTETDVIDNKLAEFDGSDEELEMTVAVKVEGEDFIDEDSQPIEDAKKLTYQERQKLPDKMFAVVKVVKNKVTGKPRKIRMFPIDVEARVRNALARLGQTKVKDTLKKLGISVDSVKKKVLKRAKELNMKTLLNRHKGEIELLPDISQDDKPKEVKSNVEDNKKQEVKVDEQAKEIQAKVEKLEAELASVTKERDEFKAKLDEIEKAEKEAKLKARKDELGEEYTKDVADEDILDDLKFENLKLKKENAELKKGKKIEESSLEVGTKDKDSQPEWVEKQKKVDKMAYGYTEEE